MKIYFRFKIDEQQHAHFTFAYFHRLILFPVNDIRFPEYYYENIHIILLMF